MCLLLLAWNAHPDYPFVFAGNRDEMHTRATRQAHWWEGVPEVLGGRDLQAGGSWLGIGRDGRFAVVTNYRDGRRSDKTARSRGLLVSDFLASSQSPEEFTALLDSTAHGYTGFNLLFGNRQEIHYFSNRGGSNGQLADGIHGLSNHLLNTPWRRVSMPTRPIPSTLWGQRFWRLRVRSIPGPTWKTLPTGCASAPNVWRPSRRLAKALPRFERLQLPPPMVACPVVLVDSFCPSFAVRTYRCSS